MSICKNNLGDNHPFFAFLEIKLGSVAQDMGDFKKSEQYYLDASRIIKNKLGDHSDRYTACASHLAEINSNLNKPGKGTSTSHL